MWLYAHKRTYKIWKYKCKIYILYPFECVVPKSKYDRYICSSMCLNANQRTFFFVYYLENITVLCVRERTTIAIRPKTITAATVAMHCTRCTTHTRMLTDYHKFYKHVAEMWMLYYGMRCFNSQCTWTFIFRIETSTSQTPSLTIKLEFDG